jgi:hypothetical protein
LKHGNFAVAHLKEQPMSFFAMFDIPGMTSKQYDAVIVDLTKAGEAAPAGRLHHQCGPTANGWMVIDTWASQAQLERFARTLIPTLQKNGVAPPEPKIVPLHNRIMG